VGIALRSQGTAPLHSQPAPASRCRSIVADSRRFCHLGTDCQEWGVGMHESRRIKRIHRVTGMRRPAWRNVISPVYGQGLWSAETCHRFLFLRAGYPRRKHTHR
jgi:hypothetical protein